jgi:hypothetical protein
MDIQHERRKTHPSWALFNVTDEDISLLMFGGYD